MTPKTNRKTSQDMESRRTRAPHLDKQRELQEAIIEDSGETADSGRDLVRGEGGSINSPEKPGDLSKDD